MFEKNIIINDTKYINRNGLTYKIPELPNLSITNITKHMETLSLPLFHEMNLVNLERIGDLKSKITISPIITTSIILALLIIIFIITKGVKTHNRKRPINNLRMALNAILRKSEDGLNLSQRGVKTRV